MSNLLNHVSKQQLHFMALIIVVTLENFTLRTLWSVIFWSIWTSASCASLPHYLKMSWTKRV